MDVWVVGDDDGSRQRRIAPSWAAHHIGQGLAHRSVLLAHERWVRVDTPLEVIPADTPATSALRRLGRRVARALCDALRDAGR